MQGFKNSEGIIIVRELIKTIQNNKEYLSEIDGAIGDGDHGINMNKGFTSCGEKLKNIDADLTEGLKVLGTTLMMETGGSMGPLYGTIFIEMSKASNTKDFINVHDFGEMLTAALQGIRKFDKAKVGDKTLIDSLEPAVDAYKMAVEEGKSFHEALSDMKVAAERGRDSTKALIARIGRAARLGERSRGVLDPGATSCCLILSSMADTIMKHLV